MIHQNTSVFDVLTSFLSVFRDLKTADPFIEKFEKDDGQAVKESKPNHVYMDCVLFGLGMCCTQVQIRNFLLEGIQLTG